MDILHFHVSVKFFMVCTKHTATKPGDNKRGNPRNSTTSVYSLQNTDVDHIYFFFSNIILCAIVERDTILEKIFIKILNCSSIPAISIQCTEFSPTIWRKVYPVTFMVLKLVAFVFCLFFVEVFMNLFFCGRVIGTSRFVWNMSTLSGKISSGKSDEILAR